MAGIFRFFVFFVVLGTVFSVAVLSEGTAQTKGKTPLQICNEKYSGLKGMGKTTAIQGCVDAMTKGK